MEALPEVQTDISRWERLGITKEEYEKRLAQAIEEAKKGILNSKCFADSKETSESQSSLARNSE